MFSDAFMSSLVYCVVTRYDYTLMREVILQTNYFTKFNFTMCIVSKCRQSYNWWLKWFWEKLNLFIFPKLMFNAGDCAITCADTRCSQIVQCIFAGYV